MSRTTIMTGKPWETGARHAPGTLVEGKILFTSGLTARNPDGVLQGPGDMAVQAAQVCQNMKDVLAAAGTDTSSLAKLVIYVTSIDEFMKHSSAIADLFSHKPSSTLIEVPRLQEKEMVIEIEAMAEVA